jgi:hypothetical protein
MLINPASLVVLRIVSQCSKDLLRRLRHCGSRRGVMLIRT